MLQSGQAPPVYPTCCKSDNRWVKKRLRHRLSRWSPAVVEAVDEQGDHAVGLAVSSDGLTWRRQEVPGRAAGGPVLRKAAWRCGGGRGPSHKEIG